LARRFTEPIGCRSVDRPVLVHHPDLCADSDPGGAAYHHPVFVGMMMLSSKTRASDSA
jgi:hypothetical protein